MVLMVVGLMGLLTLCYCKPDVCLFLARIFVVLAIGGGVGWFILGLVAFMSREELNLFDVSNNVLMGIGWGLGAGLIISGILALILSFTRSNRNPPSLSDSGRTPTP
jgi:hypothetical protein